MQKTPVITLADFLEIFPEIELPITLTDSMQVDFSRNNPPFPSLMIEQYIASIEDDIDEYTEFIPCFKLMDTHEFHAVVYWKGGLMNYQYVMATISKKGTLIDKAIIAGTYSDGNSLIQSVTTIEKDWMIYIISGKSPASQQNYDASTSKAFNLELLADGKIITSDE